MLSSVETTIQFLTCSRLRKERIFKRGQRLSGHICYFEYYSILSQLFRLSTLFSGIDSSLEEAAPRQANFQLPFPPRKENKWENIIHTSRRFGLQFGSRLSSRVSRIVFDSIFTLISMSATSSRNTLKPLARE
jgi:hypothetical protein